MARAQRPNTHSALMTALLLTGALLAPTAARAEDAQELAEKLQQSRKGLVEAEVQKRKILGSLYVINKRMKKITSAKSNLTNELFQVQDNVKNIAKIIANLEIQIEKQRHQLRRRLRALYKLSGQGYIAILFSRESSSDFDETLRFLKIVTENDYLLIKNYQENVATYKHQRNRLRGQVEKLVAIEKNIKKQETLLASEHKAKSKIVSELDQTKMANLNQIKTIRKRALSGEATTGDSLTPVNFGDLLKPSIFEQKGQLPTPIQGQIVQDFGLVTDEKYKIRLSHKGWRFAAARGTPVSSIYDGTVIHSNWVDGYGQTIVIDHGDHYYTVYGHLSGVKVKAGESVKKGQVFAEAGPATRNQPEGVYFEIRHFSEPENPANWIMKKHIQQASIALNNSTD